MQLAAPDRLRGRIIGIYFYAYNGTGPIAGLLAGWLCARGGTQLAFVVAGLAGLAGTVAAGMRLRRQRPTVRAPEIHVAPQRNAA
jgi:MFS family permease